MNKDELKELMAEDTAEMEMHRATWELTVKYGNVEPNEMIRRVSARMLINCIKWIREAENPYYYLGKEIIAMTATTEDFGNLLAFVRKWQLYRKLVGVSSLMDYINASLTKSKTKLEEAKNSKRTKEFDETNETLKISNIVLDLIARTICKRVYTLHLGDLAKEHISKVDFEGKKIRIKDIQLAADKLGIKIKSKDIYLMKKFFGANN